MNKKYKVLLFVAGAYVLANEQYKQRKALELLLRGAKEHNEILKGLTQNEELKAANNLRFFFDGIKNPLGAPRG